MNYLLYAGAIALMCLNTSSIAEIDTRPLPAKASQQEMDIAYDMTQGTDDLTAAKTYNQAQSGHGSLSIQLNPELKFAQFNLVLPSKEITTFNSEQLKAQANGLSLWSNLFKFHPSNRCKLQQYEVKQLMPPQISSTHLLAETSINWLMNCPDLKNTTAIDVGLFTALAPKLHTIRVDWLTPSSMGIQKNTLPISIKPYQTEFK